MSSDGGSSTEQRVPPYGVAVLVGVTAAHAFAVAASRFLPFVDLPQHVAAARLLANLGRPELAALYEVDLVPQVNVLSLLLGTPLHALLPEGAAVRVLVVLGIAALAAAVLRLGRAAGASGWGAAAAMPLALHFGWMYGFLSFGLGIPILIFLLARLAAARACRARVLACDALLWWLLALAHVLLFAFGIASLALWFLFADGIRRARLRRASAVAPALLWVVAWWASTRTALARIDPGSLGSGIEAYWHGPAAKLAEVGRALVVASTSGGLEWSVLVALGVVAATAVAIERRAGSVRSGLGWLRLVALLAICAYAFLPYSIYARERVTVGLFILYPRFLVLAPLVILPLLAWPRGRLSAGLAAIVCAANIFQAWNTYAVCSRAARDAVGLDTAIASIPPGHIVKSLVYTPHPTGLRYEAFLHAASYYQARKLGETDQSFALLPTNPVRYRDPRRPYLSRHDEHLRPQEFDWERGKIYDYVLVYDRDGAWRRFYEGSGRPSVFAHHGWLVLGPP